VTNVQNSTHIVRGTRNRTGTVRGGNETNPTGGIPGLHLRVGLGHRRDAKELVTA
jgi:hypothetical protein